MKPVEQFLIRFTKEVVFRDMHGTGLKTYAPGDVCEAMATMNWGWVTAWGGVYYDEAEVVQDD